MSSDIADLFTDLARLCRGLDSSSSATNDAVRRENLIQSLRELVDTFPRNDIEGEISPSEQILLTEEVARNVCLCSKKFLDSHRDAFREANALYSELCTMCLCNKKYQVVLLQSRYLMAACGNNVLTEEQAIERVLTNLQDLYTTDVAKKEQLLSSCDHLLFLLSNPWVKVTNVQPVLPSSRQGNKSEQRVETNKNFIVTAEMSLYLDNLRAKSQPSPSTIGSSHDLNVPPVPNVFPFSICKPGPGFQKWLILGKEGYGKTYICNEIECNSGQEMVVYRMDIIGRTIGEMEDKIISFFNCGQYCHEQHAILLVDDFDKAIGNTDLPATTASVNAKGTGNDEDVSHSSARALSTFLAMMDIMDSVVANFLHSKTTFTAIFTAKANVDLHLTRFDQVFLLAKPSYEERKLALAQFVGFDQKKVESHAKQLSENVELALSKMAASTAGLSYAEMAQMCRKGLLHDETNGTNRTNGKLRNSGSEQHLDTASRALEALRVAVQTFAPPSLRSGPVEGYVDMRVLSGEDLLSTALGKPSQCPLFGEASELAWKELESQIVIPLCRERELNLLLFNNENPSAHGRLRGGVVITGPPGTGKSSLARHCATFAVSLLSSVKLMEVSCTSLIHKEVGASEKAIHHLFECARCAAPCIVILDDVAILSSVRGHDTTTQGTMDRVLSTMLTELDGVDLGSPESDYSFGIAVIGITQNINWIDPALLRPGRLGKTIVLDAPDWESRRLIAVRELELSFSDTSLEEDLSKIKLLKECEDLARSIATRTEGMTGANTEAFCSNAKQSCISKYGSKAKASLPSPFDLLASIRNYMLELPDTENHDGKCS